MIYSNELISETIQSEYRRFQDIKKLIHSNGVVLYGAGFVGGWAADFLRNEGVKVLCFIDKNRAKWSQLFHGLKIFSPESENVPDDACVLITARHKVRDIINEYSSCSWQMMSFEAFYCIEHQQDYFHVRDNIFDENLSKETLNALMFSMLTGSKKPCMDMMVNDMYFCLPEFSGTFFETFVDAGAYVGDTVERFIWKNLGDFEKIYAFEPGQKQFKSMENRIERLKREWGLDEKRILLFNKGLSSDSRDMTFQNTTDVLFSSYALVDANANEDNKITTCTLDDVLAGEKGSFIKADVEGMEIPLLWGGKSSIQAWHPKMALCAYHYPCDLFMIPRVVRSFYEGYCFKLRQHAPKYGEFVLYCYTTDM